MKKVFYSAWILILLFLHHNSFGQYQAYVSPSNRILDISNTVVGSTAGNFAVNNFGEATYSIPIFCSPGTAGLVPDIRIDYNSNYPNGLLGIGWDIAGLSTINRVPKNYYNDSAIDGVDLASTDRFALDSNRLILTNGTYGANLSEYRTELETFAKITANGTAGTGPSWFKVETKDGRTIEYGNTSDSKVEAYGSSTVYQWRINKITDRFGNYMTFTYNEINGESYISRIDYTGNTPGWQPYNALKFIYAQRTDKNFNYVGGKKVPSTVILNKIRMETEEILSHRYVFKYFKDFLDRSYLNEVIEYGSDGSRFNSTIFGWPALNSTNFSWSEYSNGVQNIYHFGNFIKEGQTSFIIVPRKTTYSPTDTWKLFSGQILIYQGQVGQGFMGITVADTDGDGIDNIYIHNRITHTYNCNPHPCSTSMATLSDESIATEAVMVIIPPPPADTCWDVCTYWDNIFSSYEYDPHQDTMVREIGADINLPGSPSIYHTMVADLDGNGKEEVLILRSDNNIYSISGINVYGSYPNFNFPNDVRVLDFDGDRREELLVIKDNTSYIYQYDDITHQFTSIYSSTTFPTSSDRIFIGDFNGDHKDDILAYKSGWSVKFSTGSGFISGSSTPALRTYDPNASLLDNNYYIGDFDGDGLSDIAEIYKVSPSSVIRYFYSKGETFSGAFSYTFYKANINQDYFTSVRMPVGEYDKLFYYDYSLATNTPSVVGLLSTAFDPRITQIKDGLNRSIEIAYKPLGYNLVYDWSGFVSNYPLRTLMGRHYVVESVATSTGVLSGSGTEIISTETYSYKGLRYNANGKGLMGFEELIINESETQLGVYKTFNIDPETYYVYPKKIETKKMSGNTAFILTNHLNKVDYQNNGFYPYFDIVSTNDVLNGDLTTVTQEVDGYGNLTLQSKNINNGEASESTEFSGYTSYGNFGVPNKPSSVTITNTYQEKPSAVSTVEFTYYPNGLIHEEKKRPGTSKESKSTFSYNTVGNLSSIVLSATGLTSRNTSFSYDSKNRFVTSVLEPDGKTHSAVYNPIYGVPTSRTEVNGLTTTFQYNGFGRIIKIITPQNHEIIKSLNWNSQPQTYQGIYYSYDQIPGRPDNWLYYDRNGRLLKSVTDGFQYQINQINEYYSDGSLYRTSLPYFSYETPRWTTYEYDDFGRATEVNSNGLISTITYQGHSIETVDPSGRHKVTILNGLGKPIQVTEDNSPTITYDYNSFWGISSISTTGNIISYFYDQFGFQDSTYNPYSGGVKYIYNAFGELVSQKDAKNQSVIFNYDVLGRVVTTASPEGITSYFYYTDGNGIRQLSGISSPGNVSESYSYDTLGRLETFSKSIQNQIQMNYSFGYDTYGNNISMTYPTGLEIINVYDNNGYLTEIKKPDGYSIWKLNNLRATGMPSNYTLGYNTFNLDKQFNYNSFENLTHIKTGNWQQIYNFDDTTGNLMSRSYKDLTNPSTLKTETFQYDGLDRLRYAQVTGLQLQEVNYNPSGNIISKSGLGNYTYDQSKTNSLLSVGNTDQLIPSTSQNIQYNYHNKPDLITEGVLEYGLLYGADNQRIKSTLKNNSTEIRTMFYGPGYEKVVTPDSTWESCYISSPYGAEAMVVKKGSLERLYYIEKDHLGSIIGLISSTGSYIERHAYDPWGRRRNPTNWSFGNVSESKLTSWGYTGQEHLDMFGLINMNGRVYDPVISRFLNVDPIVQNPGKSQNFNSYSYCLNNPLRYRDPSGYYLQALKDQYYNIGRFYYRGGFQSLNDDGEWVYYGLALTQGGLKPMTDLSYDARHMEQYHRDLSGNLRGNNGNYIYQNSIPYIAQSLSWPTQTASNNDLSFDLLISDDFGGNAYLVTSGNLMFYHAKNYESIYWSLLTNIYSTPNGCVVASGQGGNNFADYVELGGDIGGPIGSGAKNILDNRGAYMPRGQIYKMNKAVTVRTPVVNINTTSKVLNYTRLGGKVLVVGGVVATGYQVGSDISNGDYYSAGARAAVFGVAAGAAFIPVVGWGVAIGIGVADFVWGDQFYNWVETKMGD